MEFNSILKESFTVIKWDISMECKNGSKNTNNYIYIILINSIYNIFISFNSIKKIFRNKFNPGGEIPMC